MNCFFLLLPPPRLLLLVLLVFACWPVVVASVWMCQVCTVYATRWLVRVCIIKSRCVPELVARTVHIVQRATCVVFPKKTDTFIAAWMRRERYVQRKTRRDTLATSPHTHSHAYAVHPSTQWRTHTTSGNSGKSERLYSVHRPTLCGTTCSLKHNFFFLNKILVHIGSHTIHIMECERRVYDTTQA